MADNTLEMALLFDFFGDLLSEKQREYFDLYYNDDLSLSEIAEISGISRQGVRDMLKKAESSLREYEEKTGVVARFTQMQKKLMELKLMADKIYDISSDNTVKSLAHNISAGLDELKG
jgi:hypothetical protein